MVMSVKTTVSKLYHRASPYLLTIVCLLLIICLTSNLIAYKDTVTEDRVNIWSPEITIPQGKLRGVNMTTIHGRTVHGFIGIPFAQPPVGDLRFKAPLPPTPWNGTFNAINDSPSCVQMERNEVVGDEDCLHLNVFTPKLPTNESSTLLPVIFYLYGGAFQTGSDTIQQMNPDFFLDKDVILVVPNHRVDVLGWLSTGDEVSPGNNGLKDNVRALKWNRDNIKYFGGDPERVTLAGSSTGAMSISMLLISDSTKGLFHQSIQEGGSGLEISLREPVEVLVKRASTLGAHFGCPTNTSTLLVECLRSLKASQLVDTTSLFGVSKLIQSRTWHPTVEPDIKGAFLTKPLNEIMASGNVRYIPCIRGTAHDDGLVSTAALYADKNKFEEIFNKIDYFLPYLLAYADVIENVPAYTATLRSYYLNDFTANDELLLTNLTQLVGDFTFVYPLYKELIQYVALAKSPQYYFVLDYRNGCSLSYAYSGGSTKNLGVAHSDIILYLFRDYGNRSAPSSYRCIEADLKIVETMVELYTSFAINGKPNAKNENGTNIWEPYSTNRNYLRVGNGKEARLEAKYGWNQERMDFMATIQLKFKAPLPPNPWKGILDSSFTTVYVQIDPNKKVIGVEDCLCLNVYTYTPEVIIFQNP